MQRFSTLLRSTRVGRPRSAGSSVILAVVAVMSAGVGGGSHAHAGDARLWQAQAPGNCLIVAASRRTLDQSLDYIVSLPERRDVRLFRSANGWFAITVAEVPTLDADFHIRRLIRAGYPSDMFCSSGSRFGNEIDWTLELRGRPASRPDPRPAPPPATGLPEVFKAG